MYHRVDRQCGCQLRQQLPAYTRLTRLRSSTQRGWQSFRSTVIMHTSIVPRAHLRKGAKTRQSNYITKCYGLSEWILKARTIDTKTQTRPGKQEKKSGTVQPSRKDFHKCQILTSISRFHASLCFHGAQNKVREVGYSTTLSRAVDNQTHKKDIKKTKMCPNPKQ